MLNYEEESQYYNQYGDRICGIDEAGRGPLCGPVYAAAVILPYGEILPGINDSKKLSEKKREILYQIIMEKAISVGIGFATNEEIDKINILNATFLAMRRAVENMEIKPDFLLVDGNRLKELPAPAKCVIKGDGKVISIAAASIIAKVTRDNYMKKLSLEYPQYQLEKHKGYPTKLHYELINKYGIAPIYRKSFLKNLDRHCT